MGCTDQESNFQTTSYLFIRGKWGWWSSWGHSPQYLCHDLDILKEKVQWSVDRGTHWNVRFDDKTQKYVATPGEGDPGVFVQS